MLNHSPQSSTATSMMPSRMMPPQGSALKIAVSAVLAVILLTPPTKMLGQGFTVSQGGTSLNAGGADSAQAKSIVQAYVRQALPPPHAVTFLDWKDYSTTGPTSAITLKYQDQSGSARSVVATVRFQIEGGKVTKTQVLQNGPSVASMPTSTPASAQTTNAPAQTDSPEVEMNNAIEQVKKIVNQPVSSIPRNQGMRVSEYSPGWFHDGARKPDFDHVDIRKSQKLEYEKFDYVTSDLNHGVVFRGKDLEFNPNTKFFYTDRSLPKKRLTESEMIEINRLYRIIGECQRRMKNQ